MSTYLVSKSQIPSVPQSFNFSVPQLQASTANLSTGGNLAELNFFLPQSFVVHGSQLIPQPATPVTQTHVDINDFETFISSNYNVNNNSNAPNPFVNNNSNAPNPFSNNTSNAPNPFVDNQAEKTEGTLKPRYHSVLYDNETFHSITVMGQYQNKSFEELRLEDYINYQKNPAAYSKEKLENNKLDNKNTSATSSTFSSSSCSIPVEENYAKKYAEAMGEVKSILGDAIRKMNQLENLTEHYLCVVCKSIPKDIAFLPCAHFSCCDTCSKQLNTCPICRQPIQTKLKLHT